MSASLNVSDQDADAHQQMHFLSFVTFEQVRVETRHQLDIIILTCYSPDQVQNMSVSLRMFLLVLFCLYTAYDVVSDTLHKAVATC